MLMLIGSARLIRPHVSPLRIALFLLILPLVLLPTSVASSEISVSGMISSDTTWAVGDSPIVVTGNVTVDAGVTLTIEPGVTVKFDGGKALDINGTLVARGTSTSTVTFTSSAVSPAAGDWKFIRFNSTASSSTFDGSATISLALSSNTAPWSTQASDQHRLAPSLR